MSPRKAISRLSCRASESRIRRWSATAPDSAAAAYQLVVKSFPNSARASAALYKLGLIAEQRGDHAGARVYFQRVLAGYPRSEEAPLAREKLQAPRR